MNPSFIPIIALWIILFMMLRNKRRAIIAKQLFHKRKTKGNNEMIELATKFIDKECIVSSFDGAHGYVGIIKEVTDGALLLEKDGKLTAINLDFIISIREYPRKKNGKKKSVVLD